MKDFGSILLFTDERNEDLMRAYRHCLSVASSVPAPDIFKLVADSPAKRFWVSPERAAVVVSALIAGRPVGKMRPNKARMFQEIYRRYLIHKKKYPHLSTLDIVSIVVNEPAPRFYLTPRTVGELISRIRRRFKEGEV